MREIRGQRPRPFPSRGGRTRYVELRYLAVPVAGMAASSTAAHGDVAYCMFCPCRILRTSVAAQVERDVTLPPLPSKEATAGKMESNAFWMVTDHFSFDNVGFSKETPEGRKYLLCADCEKGPIGYVDVSAPKEIFLSCDRVQLGGPRPGAGATQQDPVLLRMVREQMASAQSSAHAPAAS